MVTQQFIKSILRRLENYLLHQTKYRLGENYSLILLTPTQPYSKKTKFSLLLSANILDSRNEFEILTELLKDFERNLAPDLSNLVSRVNLANSNSTFVLNFRFIFPSNFINPVLEIKHQNIGGVEVENAFAVKSTTLDELKQNRATYITTISGNFFPAGILRLDQHKNLIYYTAKGLKVLFKQSMTEEEKKRAEQIKRKSEEFKFKEKYLDKIPLSEIEEVGPRASLPPDAIEQNQYFF